MKFRANRLPFELDEEIANYLSFKDFCHFKRAFCIQNLVFNGKYSGDISREILYILKYCKIGFQAENTLISIFKWADVLNFADQEKITLYVIRSNYTTALKFLINAGVDVIEFKSYKKIFKYVNTVEAAQVLITAANLDVNHCQALIYSSRADISEYLIVEQQAHVNLRDPKRYTALHFAPSLEIAQILVRYGANTCALSLFNSTPLHYARSPEIAKFLLDHGSHVNLRDNFGASPLHLAKSQFITQVLIAYGANVHSKDLSGRTPLHLTRCTNQARILLNNGADVNARDDHGQSPLFDYNIQAPMTPELSQFLLDNGAFVNLTDRYGRTCLFLSKTEENSKVLIARGGFDSYDFMNIDRVVNDQRR